MNKKNMIYRYVAVIAIFVFLTSLLPGPVLAAPLAAQVVTPVPGPALDIVQMTVNDGPDEQYDPHVSGDWVSYTDGAVDGIHFQNLDLGAASDRIIPHDEGFNDTLSDIDSNNIVFAHWTDSGYQTINLVQIDPFGNPGPAVEVSPITSPTRSHAAIGGDTIAYDDRSYIESTADPKEISISSATDPAAPPFRLTYDEYNDEWPAVSPDGNAIVWVKGPTSTERDVWRTERTAGVWSAPEQITDADGNESLPDTNGLVTVYGSTAGGDDNIRWSVKDGPGTYVESVLDLPGIQRNPNISGSLILFESGAGADQQYDLYVYDLSTNRLYQLTDTLFSESWSNISTGPGGLVRVVYALPKQVYPYDLNVYALSFVLDITPPSVTIDQAAGQADPAAASPVHFTATFSEPVSEFENNDVTLSGSAGAATAVVTEIEPNDGTTYDVAVSGMTAGGTVTAVISANAAVDAAGNGNLPSTSTDNTVTFGVPDLVIAKSHSGNFSQGGSGQYTLTVSNSGNGPTSGVVTVVDTPPVGMNVSYTSSGGWFCEIDTSTNTMTCTLEDPLPPGGSYPVIDMGVNVAPDAPASLTNTATVSGGGEMNTGNNTASDPTTIEPVVTATGQIAPLTATCAQFAAGNAANLDDAVYTVQNGRIRRITPAAFFYYSKVVAPASSFTITVTQSHPGGWPNLGNYFSFFNPQINVFNASCTRIYTSGTFMPAAITFNMTNATPGAAYYVGIRYQADSVVGKAVTSPNPGVSYSFATSVNSVPLDTTTDSINFHP